METRRCITIGDIQECKRFADSPESKQFHKVTRARRQEDFLGVPPTIPVVLCDPHRKEHIELMIHAINRGFKTMYRKDLVIAETRNG